MKKALFLLLLVTSTGNASVCTVIAKHPPRKIIDFNVKCSYDASIGNSYDCVFDGFVYEK